MPFYGFFVTLRVLVVSLALAVTVEAQGVVESAPTDSTTTLEDSAIVIPDDELRRYLIVSGWSHHLRIPSHDRVNGVLTGLGCRQEFSRDQDQVWSVQGGFYNDSRSRVSLNVGVEWMQQSDFLDFGLAGGLTYNPRFQGDFGAPVLPYLLPFVQKQIDGVGLRVFYFPPVPGHTYTEQVIFQMHLEI